MIIWEKDGEEELGRKLRRRKRDEEETHITVILTTRRQHEREGIFIGLFIEFKLNLPGPSFLSRHPRVFLSAEQPTDMYSTIAFRINDNATQVGWRPATPNDLMCTVEALSQQRAKAPF